MQAQSLSQEDPLDDDMATLSRIPAWRIPWTEEPWGGQWGKAGTVHGVAESRMRLSTERTVALEHTSPRHSLTATP